MTNRNPDMIKAADQIQAMKIDPSMTIQDIWDEFYNIMRENGIKQGQYTNEKETARTVATPEWSLFCSYLQDIVSTSLIMMSVINHVPEDLKAYKFEETKENNP